MLLIFVGGAQDARRPSGLLGAGSPFRAMRICQSEICTASRLELYFQGRGWTAARKGVLASPWGLRPVVLLGLPRPRSRQLKSFLPEGDIMSSASVLSWWQSRELHILDAQPRFPPTQASHLHENYIKCKHTPASHFVCSPELTNTPRVSPAKRSRFRKNAQLIPGKQPCYSPCHKGLPGSSAS